MRRIPAATPLSSAITNGPMSPVARTCVPPHSSDAEARHADDADVVAVLFAEQRHGACGDRVLGAAVDLGRHRRIAIHLLVDDALDAFERSSRVIGCEVREVEAQAIGRDERALLLHVRAEHLPQRRVEQMRRGVIAARGVARRRRRPRRVTMSRDVRVTRRHATRCARGVP